VILVVLYLACFSGVQSWDPFGIDKAVQDLTSEIQSVGLKLIGAAKQAFDTEMNLFMKNVTALFDKIQTFISADINQINNDINATIAHIENVAIAIINVAGKTAIQFANFTITEIEQKIIGSIFTDVNTLLTTFNNDIENIMNTIITQIHSIECEVDKTLNNFKNLVYSLHIANYPVGPKINASDPCRVQYGLGDTDLEQLTPEQIYNLTTCQALSGLTINTPIKTIWLTYGYMQYVCQMLSCNYNESPVLVKFFTHEYLSYTALANVWEQYINQKQLEQSQKELLLRKQLKSLGVTLKQESRLIFRH